MRFGFPILIVLVVWFSFQSRQIHVFKAFNFYSFNTLHLLAIIVINVCFTSFNWLIDSWKWQSVLRPKLFITLKTAICQNLKSHSWAIMTPHRMGDYAAKALFFSAEYRTFCLGCNLVAQTSQLISTLGFGILGLIYYLGFSTRYLNLTQVFIVVMVGLALVIIGIKTPFFKYKIAQLKPYIHKFPRQVKLSVLKHFVFSYQLYIIFLFFNIDLGYLECYMAINVMYVLSSIIPSVFVLDLAIKGSVGVLIFSFLNIDVNLVLISIALMWVFNFAIPAVVGSFIPHRQVVLKLDYDA